MTSLGSALALAPPLRTALLLIPSNGVGVSARARILLMCVCWYVCVSLYVCVLYVLSLSFSIASCAGGVRIEWCSVLRK